MKKRNFILVMCFALLIGVFGMSSRAFAEELPRISFVGVEHSPLIAGENETFYITSVGAEKVEYRIWIKKDGDNKWEDLLGRYAGPYDANTPVFVKPPEKFEKGKYTVSIWVRRAGKPGKVINKNGNYDNYYVAYLNCVDKGTRVSADGDLDVEKSLYKVGEKVVINGIKDLKGSNEPFLYKLHVFNNSKMDVKDDMWNGKGWAIDVTDYGEKIEWVPKEPGMYVLDVWGKPENSNLKFQVWKLKVIKVVNADGTPGGSGTSDGSGTVIGGDTGSKSPVEILSILLRMKSGEDVDGTYDKDEDVYTFDLRDKSDDNKFMGLNIEVSENCEMSAGGNTVSLSKGVNYKTVKQLNNGEDPGKPGVSIAKLKSYDMNTFDICLNSKSYTLEFLFKCTLFRPF